MKRGGTEVKTFFIFSFFFFFFYFLLFKMGLALGASECSCARLNLLFRKLYVKEPTSSHAWSGADAKNAGVL